jgi:hypothetical protein
MPREEISMAETAESVAVLDDGRHAFDFIAGRWHTTTRVRVNPFDQSDPEWIEFPAEFTSMPILGGLGTADVFKAPEHPRRDNFEAFILRLFDPSAQLWRIWWVSTISNGQLDVPVVGRFHDKENGIFECDDVINEVPLKVRGTWKVSNRDSVHWEQAFSFDGGATWEPNWISDATRVDTSE